MDNKVFTNSINSRLRSKKMIYFLINGIVVLILVFTLSTIMQSLFDRFSINRVIGGLIIVFSGTVFLQKPKINAFVRMAVMIIISIFTIAMSLNLTRDLTDFIYLFSTILIISIVSDKSYMNTFMDCLKKRIILIELLVYLECGILLFLIVTKNGYSVSWGGEKFFLGYCNSEHTMGSLCCMIISMILYIVTVKGKHILLYSVLVLIPSYAIFETGARTFLFPMAILLFLYVQYTVKKRLFKYLIYCFGIIIISILLIRSNMMNKFSFTANNIYVSDILSSYTSGRSNFWKIDLDYFLSGNFFQILFGRTFNDVYETNYIYFNMRIWAHNDVIHLLVGTGVIGAFIYLSFVISSLKTIKPLFSNKILYLFAILYIFIPLLVNGFFICQHLVFSFIILFITVISKKKADNNGQCE